MSVAAFRFRVFVFVLLYLLGFVPPWDLHNGSRGTFWLAAATVLGGHGWIGLAGATLAVTLAALTCLVLGSVLRVWGTAYLGSGVMQGSAMQGQVMVAAGPYRFVRNPLYLGSWLVALGTSILMPTSGAAFFLPAFSIFLLFLISAEERFLLANVGNAYREYCGRVPRLVPRVMALDAGAAGARPRWIQAFLAEVFPLAFTVCFAIFAWRYNARTLIQCLLICYGISLVIRALSRPPAPHAGYGS